MARVIGAEDVEKIRAAGRNRLEILPGDIVTDLARESAERLGIRLLDGPLERPAVHRTDGGTNLRRSLYRRSARWITPQAGSRRQAQRLGKLAIVGAGGVGGNIAHLAANADLSAEIALIDVIPGLAEATALDLMHAAGITRSAAHVTGSTSLGAVEEADVVVVTAGRPRTPGMSRSDLVGVNARVIRAAAEAIKTRAPHAIVIVVTNPLDEMTTEMLRATGFPRERVIGMAGTLDSARFRLSLAKAADVDPADVQAITLGSHGDEMAPIASQSSIKGRALEAFLDADAIAACVKDAVTGGGQVVALKKTGSATLAPAHATVELIDHIRGARAGWVPASVMLTGEYGIDGVVLGVPCHLGASGLLSVEELRLTDEERASLNSAAEAIRARLAA
ncbi:MAG: malate dehydrogenase [Pseudomonadota bacterium]